MTKPVCDDNTFVRLFEEYGPLETARRLKLHKRVVYGRREFLEKKYKRQITPPDHRNNTRFKVLHPQRAILNIENGVVLVGSDAHYWPGQNSVTHRAFVKFCKELKPKAVIMNGDVLDFCQISRHPPIGWEKQPTVEEEISAAKDRLGEIEAAAFKAEKIWTLGNHDGRFETRIATVAPEFAKVHGVHLSDHFPLWRSAWSCWINDRVVVKHRFKGGLHAPHNNTMWAGKTIITGHLHSAKVVPFTDYSGTRYGVDTGCIADIYSPQFTDYTEDNPRNWRSAFGVLTFHKGDLLMPELVLAYDEDSVQFHGELVKV